MLPYIHIIVPLYGVFAALGMIIAVIFFHRRMQKSELDIPKLIQIAIVTAIGVLVGSRVVFALTMLPAIISDFSFSRLFEIIIGGGFVFYGGLLGAMLALYIYGKVRGINTKMLFQVITPCFPLFHAFGRIGCFLSGCCYGIPSSFGFAMAFDPTVIRFPVQLAESLCCIIIFALLLILEKKNPKINLLRVYLITYAVIRFFLEFLRGDTVRGIWGFFSISQWILFVILLICMASALKSRKKSITFKESA